MQIKRKYFLEFGNLDGVKQTLSRVCYLYTKK